MLGGFLPRKWSCFCFCSILHYLTSHHHFQTYEVRTSYQPSKCIIFNTFTHPNTSIATEQTGLEHYSPFEMASFQVLQPPKTNMTSWQLSKLDSSSGWCPKSLHNICEICWHDVDMYQHHYVNCVNIIFYQPPIPLAKSIWGDSLVELLFGVTSCDSSMLLKIAKILKYHSIYIYMKREHNRWLKDLTIKSQCVSEQTSRCIKYIAESISINLEITFYGNENRSIKHMLNFSWCMYICSFFRYATDGKVWDEAVITWLYRYRDSVMLGI